MSRRKNADIGKNRYGLDMSYFRNLFDRELNKPLADFTPKELARVLARASRTADPDVMHEPEFLPGMAIVPVETQKDAERYAWIKANCGERPTRFSGRNEFSERKIEYVFPNLIAWAEFCGQITLDEAIDFKIAAAKEKGE